MKNIPQVARSPPIKKALWLLSELKVTELLSNRKHNRIIIS